MHDLHGHQDVNLFDRELRTKPQRLSAQVLITTAVVVIVGLAGVYLLGRAQLPALQQRAALMDAQYSRQQARLAQLRAAAGRHKEMAGLDREIARLTREKRTKGRVVNLLAGQTVGNTSGFSSYLEGLARQIESGVWLRSIAIRHGGSDLSIAGSTLDPKLVLVYLRRLSKEAAFAGTEFKSFKLQRRARTPAAVDFVIKTASQGG